MKTTTKRATEGTTEGRTEGPPERAGRTGTEAGLGPGLFDFMRELAENNSREWFEANKARYEAEVRGPAIQFVLDFGPRLRRISPHFRADPRKQGGSVFRIHRDLRFSKDKRPYKTHTGIQFRHEAGKDAHAPGFYLHLEPGAVFVGVGVWRPAGPALLAIRRAIVDDPEAWRAASTDPRFRARFELGGETLTRAPRDFDPSHPLVEDLKRKDFIASCQVDEREVTRPDFIDGFEERCREAAPFVSWLCGAVGVPF